MRDMNRVGFCDPFETLTFIGSDFDAPVFADETVRLECLIIKVTPNARLGGYIVDLRGRIRGQNGQTAVGAKGRI